MDECARGRALEIGETKEYGKYMGNILHEFYVVFLEGDWEWVI